MKKPLVHIALDKWGQIVAQHSPTADGHNPLVAPEGGSVRSLTAAELAELKSVAKNQPIE